MTAASLAARVTALDIQQVEQLIGYGRNHSTRVDVLELPERQRNRLRS